MTFSTMSAACASSRRLTWKFPAHAPTCAIVGDSQTKYLYRNFDPSNHHSPAFITLPGANICDVVNLLDFVPRGVTELILHVGTNDVASTSNQVARERYSQLLDHIQRERPDIQAIFLTLLLPRAPNRRQNSQNWRTAEQFNRDAYAFNCFLVDLCRDRVNVFFLDHCLDHFHPTMVLAADGLHPNFAGVSIMSWNLYNFLFELRRPSIGEWQDHASPLPASESQQAPTHAQNSSDAEPSQLSESDWPQLTRGITPLPPPSLRPDLSSGATPVRDVPAPRADPAPRPQDLSLHRRRRQSGSPGPTTEPPRKNEEADTNSRPQALTPRRRRRQSVSPGPTAQPPRKKEGLLQAPLTETNIRRVTPQEPTPKMAPQAHAESPTLATKDREDPIATPASRYNLRKCPGSARRVKND